MAKLGRPFVYQSEEEKPVTVSLRIPHDVYNQIERYVKMHPGMSLTEFMLDGIQLRLTTPADPRDVILSGDNTVIQEVQEMIRTAVQAEIGKLSDFMGRHFSPPGFIPPPGVPAESVPELSHDDNTVLQGIGEQEQEATESPSVHDETDLSQGDTARTKEPATVTNNSNAPAPEPPTRRGVPKLTPRQVKALRAKRARGVPVKALMEEYGLSKATVFRYLAQA